ncbi:hypothetical protein QPM17_07970 [Marinobacter sp. TBZ242]|uniref:Gluconate 2-dehydrogenase subunit 3 n=1 Tax=Marinobacter azerbaijanicus TaxID=3050455 RepID=A0ABT7ICW7_9GAMM|nr:hypothetical protein [Marinobacter sp. TBZ242]MDL0431058.1 hypothetical protein [Marinobacter sp. TBZ242]
MSEIHPQSVHMDIPATTMDRRSFLRAGLGGAMFLGTVSVTAGLSGCATAPAGRDYPMPEAMDRSYEFRFLTRDDIVLFEALLPAMVGPGLSGEPVVRRQQVQATIERIDAGIHQFGPANQKELRGLFDLLNFGLTRVTVARVWSSWENASTETAHAFLERWRTSGIGLFNNGYIALTKVSNVAFYGHEDHWHLSGYPGPPAFAVDALPQFKNNA